MTALEKPFRVEEDPIQPHVHAMLAAIGEDPRREGLVDTPKRFAKALRFLTSGYDESPASVVGSALFEAEGDGPVVVRDIEFYSLCEHHVLPFFGHVHVAYLPRRRIIGLSKIPRIVEVYARRLQVQERLTSQIADALCEVVQPAGIAVLLEAKHLCMAMRGIEKQCPDTVTRAVRGVCASDPAARREILDLMSRR